MRGMTNLVALAGACALLAGCQKETGTHHHVAGEAKEQQAAQAPAEELGPRLAGVLEPYLAIQQALAEDSVAGAAEAARKIEAGMSGLELEQAVQVGRAAGKLAATADLKQARLAFKELSEPMVTWAKASPPAGTSIVYCGMFDGSWIQRGSAIRNPYHGSEMLECGRIVGGEGGAAKGKEHAGHDHAGHDHAGHAH
jgi:hypothetical protein